MKKLIITEEQHRHLFENFSLEDLQKIKSMLISPDEDNVNLGMLMLSGAGYSLAKFIVKWFKKYEEIPDIILKSLSEKDLNFIFKNGLVLSDAQFKRFCKTKQDVIDNIDIWKTYLSSGQKIPSSQVFGLGFRMPIKDVEFWKIYVKSIITREISLLKQGGDSHDRFSSDELDLFSYKDTYRIGLFGFTLDYITLEWLEEKNSDKFESYKEGLFKFLENGGVLEKFDILKYFDENELWKYIELKGDVLDGKEIDKLSKEMLRVYLEKRLKEVLNSGGRKRLDRDEEWSLDVFKDLDDIYNKYLED